MKNRPSTTNRGARKVPLDHLQPGGRLRDEAGINPAEVVEDDPRAEGSRRAHIADAGQAQPAEPSTPGAGDADAARGKATGSPAAVATRPHLEGSEQGPR